MGKLRLGIEELRVESFATDGGHAKRGAVLAHAGLTEYTWCGCHYTEDVGWHYTCAWSCVDEMGATVCNELNPCTGEC